MRFIVPQFIDVEDKIFGPLTLKQAIYVGGGAGIILILFTTLGFFWTFLIGAPIAGLTFTLAFVKINNRPFYLVIYAALFYGIGNKLYLWKKIEKKKTSKQTQTQEIPHTRETVVTQSRLKELAWSLDTSKTLYTKNTK